MMTRPTNQSSRATLVATLGLALLLVGGCQSREAPSVEVAAIAAPEPDPAAPVSWQAFAPEEQGFRVDLPGAPERVSERISSIVGPQEIIRYRGDSEAVLFYEVGYLKRTKHPLARLASQAQIMNAARRGTLEHFAASEASRMETEFQGRPSELIDVDLTLADAPAHGRLLLVLTDDRIYHVLVVPRPGAVAPDGSRRILESFALDA